MEYRQLGTSGLRLSALTLGNWATHGAQVDDAAASAVVAAALDAGITSFDTADMYAEGRAESVLGRALAGERRSSIEILTKVYWPTGPGPNDRGLSRKHIVTAVEHSLRRLGTDYIDVYQAHRFDAGVPLEETLRAFDDLVRQGKVLYIGVSEWPADRIRAALALADERGLRRIMSNQPQYSMLWRDVEREVLGTCLELGIGQLVWSPLAQGVLTGKYTSVSSAPTGTRAADGAGAEYIARWMHPEVLTAVQGLRPIAAGLGITMAQLALAWVLSQPTVASAIIGASRPEQVHDNIGAVGVSLDAATMSAIDVVLGDAIVHERPVAV